MSAAVGARVMRGFNRNGDGDRSCHDPVPIANVSAKSPGSAAIKRDHDNSRREFLN